MSVRSRLHSQMPEARLRWPQGLRDLPLALLQKTEKIRCFQMPEEGLMLLLVFLKVIHTIQIWLQFSIYSIL